MLSGQCFVFLFRQGTERPHQGDVNAGVAIPNTTEEVCNRIMLDPEMIGQPSFVYGDGGGVWISYRPVVVHLLGKISNRDLLIRNLHHSEYIHQGLLRWLAGLAILVRGKAEHEFPICRNNAWDCFRPHAQLHCTCPKPSSQPRDAARREECSQLDEESLTTFLLLNEEGERKCWRSPK